MLYSSTSGAALAFMFRSFVPYLFVIFGLCYQALGLCQEAYQTLLLRNHGGLELFGHFVVLVYEDQSETAT